MTVTGTQVFPNPPSEYFYKHVLCSFFDDPPGVRSIEREGLADNVALEVDYPHGDSTWPPTVWKWRHPSPDQLQTDTAYKVIRGNAERFFRL